MVAGGTTGPRDKDVQTLQETQVHQTKNQGMEKGSLWKHKPEEKSIEDRMRKLQELCIEEGYTKDRKKEEIQMTREWEARCQQEETPWCQKSRIRWLKEGERNTKFFHRTTIARRSHNKILKIRDQDGIERESHREIENALVKHF
jgi:hypothetical protein